MKGLYEFENEKIQFVVKHDDFTESPRDLYDNLGTVVEWHRKMDFGDKKVNAQKYENEFEALKNHVGNMEGLVYLPVYIYQHSGISIRTTPFSSMWDSGQGGWIYVKEEDYKKRNLTKERVEEILEEEIKLLDKWVSGEVYSVAIWNKEKCGHCGHIDLELEDSLSGLFGFREVKEYVRNMVDYIGGNLAEEILQKL